LGENRSSNNDKRHKIAEALASEIACGRIKPEHRLVEAQLGGRFGVKRNSVRQVLRDLEQDGFVKIVPNVGATVASLSQKDIEQTYDLLGVIEGLAVRVITPFVTPEQIEKLEGLLIKMESTNIPSQFLDFNVEFHSLISSWSENDRLIKLRESLRRNQMRFGIYSFFSPGQMTASRLDHRRIFDAMKSGKAVEAERLMRAHLLHAKNRLIKYMNKSL